MLTDISYVSPDENEIDKCSLIFRETVTKDAYVYLEEVKAQNGFEFWPGYPIDIEKPASVSQDHQIIWRFSFKEA